MKTKTTKTKTAKFIKLFAPIWALNKRLACQLAFTLLGEVIAVSKMETVAEQMLSRDTLRLISVGLQQYKCVEEELRNVKWNCLGTLESVLLDDSTHHRYWAIVHLIDALMVIETNNTHDGRKVLNDLLSEIVYLDAINRGYQGEGDEQPECSAELFGSLNAFVRMLRLDNV